MSTSSAEPGHVRGPYKNGIQRRRDILESASRVFGQHGFRGGTLRQIAEVVGVSPAGLMRHFASKEDLFMAVLRESDARNVRELFGDASGLAYFDLSPHLVEWNVTNRGLVELLLTVAAEASDPTHPAHPLMAQRYRDLKEHVCAHLRIARDAGEIRPLSDEELEREASGYIALMDGLELQWLLDPNLDLAESFRFHYASMRARWVGAQPTQ